MRGILAYTKTPGFETGFLRKNIIPALGAEAEET